MKHILHWWLLLGAVVMVPYALLALAGLLWLHAQGFLWAWVAVSVLVSGAGWLAGRWLTQRMYHLRSQRAGVAAEVAADPRWSPAGQAAWADVEALAQRAEQQDLPLDRPEPLWNLLLEVLQAVARQFRPNEAQPELEIPVPHVLRTAERVARDLHQAFSENVPGAHILTLGDLMRLKRWAGTGKELYGLYRTVLRIVRFGMNPLSAVLSEARDAAAAQLYNASVDQIKRWAVGYCVRKAGYYAIQLYSGQLVEDEELAAYRTPRSQADTRQFRQLRQAVEAEPLRIAVLGQVKAGKSSLINALLGRQEAIVDAAPQARGAQPFLFQPAPQDTKLPAAVLVELPGYDAAPGSASPWEAVKPHVVQSDLVVWVVAGHSASRLADRRLLDEMRAFFLSEPQRIPPPVVVAVTHIDRLRPWGEWSPPYDLAQSAGIKAQNIREALQAVRTDLGLGLEAPLVPVCTHPDRLYNVREGLWPAIVQAQPEAERARFQRVLQAYHNEGYWSRLGRQLLNSGGLLLRAARYSGGHLLRAAAWRMLAKRKPPIGPRPGDS